jgi:PAS domain S-box-containing protein
MAWQWTPYAILPLMVAATLIITALYILWRRRYRPASRTGAVVLLACAELMVAYALEIGGANLPTKVLWKKMQYVAFAVAPTVWLIYTLQYTGREKWLPRRVLALLSIVPPITLLLVFTNEAHGLMWRRVWLDTDGLFPVLDRTYGAGFWVFVVYSYLLMLLATFLHVQLFIRSRRLYRWQASALVFATLLPWLGNMLDVFKLSPFSSSVSTALGLILGGLTMAWTIYRLRRGDILSVSCGAIIGSMSDVVVVLDDENRIVDLNPVAEHLIGHAASEALGQPLEQMWPDWSGQIELPCNGAKVSKEVMLGQGAGQRIYDVRISPLVDWRGRLVSQVVVLRDITERKWVEEEIKTSLEEKEVLLKEIHHRVKNNLQVISSLLYLQSKNIKDEQALEMFQDSQNRVRSMSLVHERLYQSQDLARVDFAEYVRNLANHLFRSYGVNTNIIQLKINVDEVFLGVDMAIPCGLIINELVSNSLKHAFPEGRVGKIHIELCADDESQFTLMVSDNGVGFPENLGFRDTGSLGLQLVNTLVDQLEGAIELDRRSGTAFKIALAAPVDRKKVANDE